jgi:hypothetical protein
MDIAPFFSNDKIFNVVKAIRLKMLDKRNKMHSDREMSHHSNTHFHKKRNYKGDDILYDILPPRRSWFKCGSDRRKELNSKERVKFSLEQTFIKAKGDYKIGHDVPDWYIRFLCFCDDIRTRLNDIDKYEFSTPQIIPVPKKKGVSNESIDCRPLAQFNLCDRIIIGLTARYFVNVLDSEFLDNSFAFRKTTKHRQITHHDAFKEIIDYKTARSNQLIYVAEYDIKKFYDCVNHDVVLSHLSAIEERLATNNIIIDLIAKSILKKYLEVYSFNSNVYLKNDDPTWFLQRNIKSGKFPWEEGELKRHFYSTYSSINEIRIGVPQGGALSCIISNIVLDFVDRKVVNSTDQELLYVRYCDDMIIMHTQLDKCEQYANNYLRGIHESKLLTHVPQETVSSKPYSTEHWTSKAKPLYIWGENTKLQKHVIPWVGFVGYQLRHDLSIRVRKDSIKKQKNKLKDEYKRVLKAINYHHIHDRQGAHIRTNYKSIVRTFKSRLISLSIGKPHPKDFSIDKYEICWANGFRLIRYNSITKRQVADLDRTRTYYYHKIHKQIPKAKKKPMSFPEGTKFRDIYYGTPFSYYSIIKKNGP